MEKHLWKGREELEEVEAAVSSASVDLTLCWGPQDHLRFIDLLGRHSELLMTIAYYGKRTESKINRENRFML